MIMAPKIPEYGNTAINFSCFENGCPRKVRKCARQDRRVLWEMINTQTFQVNACKTVS